MQYLLQLREEFFKMIDEYAETSLLYKQIKDKKKREEFLQFRTLKSIYNLRVCSQNLSKNLKTESRLRTSNCLDLCWSINESVYVHRWSIIRESHVFAVKQYTF